MAEAGSGADTGRRIAWLDGIRGLAALYVVLHHVAGMGSAAMLAQGQQPPPILAALNYGHQAVTLFIMLSGYSLALPILRAWNRGADWSGAADFYRRRATRILPPYAAALALSIAVCALGQLKDVGVFSPRITTGSIVAHLLLIHNVTSFGSAHLQGNLGDTSFNPAFWSIAVECQIYLLFPLIVASWKRFGILPVALAGWGISSLLAWFCPVYLQRSGGLAMTFDWEGFNWPFAYCFLAGAVGAWMSFSTTDPLAALLRQRIPWALVLTFGIVQIVLPAAAAVTSDTVASTANMWLTDIPLATLVLLPLLVLCASSRRLCDVIGCNLLARLGTFAYSVYLVQFPILLFVTQRVIPSSPVLRDFPLTTIGLIGLSAVYGFAYAFHGVFERPFLKKPGGRRVALTVEAPAMLSAPASPAEA